MTRRPFLIMGCVGLWLLALRQGDTAASTEGSPEVVVGSALEALNHDRPEEFAKAMHPDALDQFRVATLELVEQGKANQLLPLFWGVKDVNELKELDRLQLLTSYLRETIRANPKTKLALAKSQIQILGHVAEGEETAHVVYRSKMDVDGAKLDRMNVISLRKDGHVWRILLPSQIEGGIAIMKQQRAGTFTFPDAEASRIEPLGHLVEAGETGHVVYRLITPLGDSSFKRIEVLSLSTHAPEWAPVREGKTAEVTKLIKRILSIK